MRSLSDEFARGTKVVGGGGNGFAIGCVDGGAEDTNVVGGGAEIIGGAELGGAEGAACNLRHVTCCNMCCERSAAVGSHWIMQLPHQTHALEFDW